ncbi:MAG: 30S ribosomal protein S15 [Chitinophagales bacterium]|nr:30S ribosomal protein S15 [Chitinophagales bacterium]
MALTAERKKELALEHGGSATNTGKSEVQIAMLTERIASMTEHLKGQKNDKNTMLSLIKLVGQRRKLLNYLAKSDIGRYRDIIAKLKIRK